MREGSPPIDGFLVVNQDMLTLMRATWMAERLPDSRVLAPEILPLAAGPGADPSVRGMEDIFALIRRTIGPAAAEGMPQRFIAERMAGENAHQWLRRTRPSVWQAVVTNFLLETGAHPAGSVESVSNQRRRP